MSSPFATLDYGSAPVNAEAARSFLAQAAPQPAVAAAQKAASAAATAWRKTAPALRAQRLRALARHMEQKAGFLAALAALDGKVPVASTLAQVVPRAVAALDHFADQAPLLAEAPGVAAVLGEGAGLAALVEAVAPVLAAGQGVVIASAAPMARAFAALAPAAGLPGGLVQTVKNDPSTEQTLLALAAISHVSFTGPRAKSLALRGQLAASGKTASFTLSGPTVLIVHDDADLDAAVEAAAHLLWPGEGHGVRLHVQEGVAPRFSGKLVNRLSRLRLGDPLDANTDLAADVKPVLPDITSFRTPDEAVLLTNHPGDAVAASVWSENLSFALDTAARLRCATVWLNGVNHHAPAAPAVQHFPRPGKNPATAEMLAAAVKAQTAWAALAPAARADKFARLAASLPARAAGLAHRLIAAGDSAGVARRVQPGLVFFTLPEPQGVLAVTPASPGLEGLVTAVLPALAAGNAVLLHSPDGAARRTLEAAAAHLPPALISFASAEKILADERLAGSFAGTPPARHKTVWAAFGT